MPRITITYQEEGNPQQQITISAEIAELLNNKVNFIKSYNPNINGKMDLFLNSIWNSFLRQVIISNIDKNQELFDNINNIELNINSLKQQLDELTVQERQLKENLVLGRNLNASG